MPTLTDCHARPQSALHERTDRRHGEFSLVMMGSMHRARALALVAPVGVALALTPSAGAQVQAPTAGARPTPAPAKRAPQPSSSKPTAKHRAKRKRPKLHGDAARADAAYTAMQRAFAVAGGSGLYKGAPYSYLWGFSEALAATIAMTRVPGLEHAYHRQLDARLQGLQSYWDPSAPAGYDGSVAPPSGPGGPKYYDDNAWVALQLLRLNGGRPQPWMVFRARQLFTLISNAWDSDQTHPCPGGIPFSNAPTNTDRNAVTTAPTAELAAQLYRLTRDSSYLQWAKRLYAWVRTCLLEPTGLYADHIRFDGTVDQTAWSYNQGTMLGAATMLYQVSGDRNYLAQARQTAQAALAYFDPLRLRSEPRFFVAVYLRNLLLLDGIRHDPAYRAAAVAYATWAWKSVRRKDTGLFVFDPTSFQLLDQASMVELYALLASPPTTYF
jgi:Glycosyl hydrolase family 76